MNLLWPLEPSTDAKHRLYRSYLDGWFPKMLQPVNGWLRPRVTYVDAFAGPGEYAGGEDGSPIIALRRLLGHSARDRMALSHERVCMAFIEKDRARHDHLRDKLVTEFGPLEKLPVRVEVRHGEAGRDTPTMLTELNAWGEAIVAIFDGCGNVNVPYPVVQRIAANRSSEVIVTFGPNWFSRRQDQEPEQLDAIFGGRAYWQSVDTETRPDERWRAWLKCYRDALGRAGFAHRLQFEVKPATGQPLHLVFGTGHPAGVHVMKDAMWKVDRRDGMAFRDPRTRDALFPGQMSLLEEPGVGEPELIELARQRLEEGPVTVGELGTWLLDETARWRPKDAAEVVRCLNGAGQVVTDPPGRVTNATRVKLRS